VLRLMLSSTLMMTLTACGVSTQDAAERLPPALAATPRPSVSERPPQNVQQRLILWFARGDRLIPEFSPLSRTATAGDVLDALVAGPTLEHTQGGLRTLATDPVTGEPLVATDSSAESDRAFVQVRVASTFTSLAPGEQVLLLGQVVLSLSDAGFGLIAFVDASGAELAVPLPDGRLLSGAAKLDDYRGLVVGSGRSETRTAK